MEFFISASAHRDGHGSRFHYLDRDRDIPQSGQSYCLTTPFLFSDSGHAFDVLDTLGVPSTSCSSVTVVQVKASVA